MQDMEYVTKVTKEDYLYSTGVDLDAELTAITTNDVGDNPSPRFIWGIEEFLIDSYKSQYAWDGTIRENSYRESCFKKAVIYQIQYVLRNGSISNDSGYNTQSGQIIPRSQLDAIGVSSMTHRMMKEGGMANWRRF